MMSFLEFTFQNGCHFFGVLMLLSVVGSFFVAGVSAVSAIATAALSRKAGPTQVQVTGTLQASGADLKAVLQQTQCRAVRAS